MRISGVYERPKTLAQGKWEIGPKGPKPFPIKALGNLRGIQEPSLDTSMRRSEEEEGESCKIGKRLFKE